MTPRVAGHFRSNNAAKKSYPNEEAAAAAAAALLADKGYTTHPYLCPDGRFPPPHWHIGGRP